jgi:hypothetical protein
MNFMGVHHSPLVFSARLLGGKLQNPSAFAVVADFSTSLSLAAFAQGVGLPDQVLAALPFVSNK